MLAAQVNHISPESEQFKDFVAKGDASEYAEMFVDWDKLWPPGESQPSPNCFRNLSSGVWGHVSRLRVGNEHPLLLCSDI